MGCRATDIAEELFKVLLSLQVILVIDRHFGEGHNFFTFLQEDLNVDVLRKGVKRIEVPLDLLIGPFLVKFFKVLPKSLKTQEVMLLTTKSTRGCQSGDTRSLANSSMIQILCVNW